MRRSSAACSAALSALSAPPALAREARAHAAHRARCSPCREAERLFAEVQRSLGTTADVLDDLTRARVLGRLLSSVDHATAEPRLPRRYGWIVATAAALLLALVGSILALGQLGDRRERHPGDRALLLPFAVERAASPGMMLGQRVGRLQVPDAIVVRALLGERAVIALAGPAELEVTRAEAGHLELTLTRGTLVASYDRSKGGRLVVRAPGASAEVIGTLFLVEVDALGQTTVAVAHGEVQVRPRRGGVLALASQRRWAERDGTAGLAPHQQELFERLAPEPSSTVTTSAAAAPVSARRARAPSLPAAAPPSILAPASSPTPVPRDTADRRYRRAEAAMRSGDRGTARRELEELVRSWPQDRLAAQARYELARLALAAGALETSARWLDAPGGREPALQEPAGYLRCRIEERRGKRALAADCLARFRARFPESPHDQAALARLILWSESCTGLPRLAREYLTRYPGGEHLRAVRDRLSHCTRGPR